MDSKDFKYNKETVSFEKSGFDICKNCIHRKDDFALNGKIVATGYNNLVCKKYKDSKPDSVIKDDVCEFKE